MKPVGAKVWSQVRKPVQLLYIAVDKPEEKQLLTTPR